MLSWRLSETQGLGGDFPGDQLLLWTVVSNCCVMPQQQVMAPRRLKCLQILIIAILIVLFVKNGFNAIAFIKRFFIRSTNFRDNSLAHYPEANVTKAFVELSEQNSIILLFFIAAIIICWMYFALLVVCTFRQQSVRPILKLAFVQIFILIAKGIFIVKFYDKSWGLVLPVTVGLLDIVFFVLLVYYSSVIAIIDEARENAEDFVGL